MSYLVSIFSAIPPCLMEMIEWFGTRHYRVSWSRHIRTLSVWSNRSCMDSAKTIQITQILVRSCIRRNSRPPYTILVSQATQTAQILLFLDLMMMFSGKNTIFLIVSTTTYLQTCNVHLFFYTYPPGHLINKYIFQYSVISHPTTIDTWTRPLGARCPPPPSIPPASLRRSPRSLVDLLLREEWTGQGRDHPRRQLLRPPRRSPRLREPGMGMARHGGYKVATPVFHILL